MCLSYAHRLIHGTHRFVSQFRLFKPPSHTWDASFCEFVSAVRFVFVLFCLFVYLFVCFHSAGYEERLFIL